MKTKCETPMLPVLQSHYRLGRMIVLILKHYGTDASSIAS
jgi:hypothetical protein